ncbi:rCG38726 [Rattus norvegicus]|uniref:RCG38726 n=1 Tax=Rattus norvegicus TaxID=10116 RepID=A6K9V4_RAT|nr:rCG38726 [Rattus norvegicus]
MGRTLHVLVRGYGREGPGEMGAASTRTTRIRSQLLPLLYHLCHLTTTATGWLLWYSGLPPRGSTDPGQQGNSQL